MSSRVQFAGLLLVLSAVLNGCVTAELWEKKAFDGFNRPAHPPNLQVYRMPGDWLIEYDEANEKNQRIRRRAYYLYQNEPAINAKKSPLFVRRPELVSFTVGQALISTNGQQFTLYDDGAALGTYEFPVYPAPSGRVKQMLLTPLTVAADVTCVVVLIGIWWFSAAASSDSAD